jgi:hypothetical protein
VITIYQIPEQHEDCEKHKKTKTAKHIWIDGSRVVIYEGNDIPNNNEAQ